jgi:hypothetical protein
LSTYSRTDGQTDSNTNKQIDLELKIPFFQRKLKFCFFQVIAAEGEQKASRALREAAETIADSHGALQVCRMLLNRLG